MMHVRTACANYFAALLSEFTPIVRSARAANFAAKGENRR
jgi:hypothetical protein